MAEVKAPALSPNLLKGAEFERIIHTATIPPGVALSSVLRPDFWAHCAGKVKPYARIECRAQDNKWFAELMVHTVGKQELGVWVLRYIDLEAQAASAREEPKSDDTYTISFAPKQRWRVIRNSDNAVIHKDEATEDSARAWLADFQKTAA